MWSQHLPVQADRDDADFHRDVDEEFQEFEDEHQEPVPRADRNREMTIRRHKDITQEDVDLSKKLWHWGFFFLPFLWLVNWASFRYALHEPTAPEEMKRNIRFSIRAFAIAIVVWVVWLVVFYTHLHGWAHPLLLFSPDTQVLT